MFIDEYGQVHRQQNNQLSPSIRPYISPPRPLYEPPQSQEQHTVRNVLVGVAVVIGVIWFISSISQKSQQTAASKPATPAATVPVIYATVRQDLNMRSGPGVKYTIVQIMRKDTKVEVVDNSGPWPKIRYNGKEGFSDRDYLRIDNSPTQVPKSNYHSRATSPSYTELPRSSSATASSNSSFIKYLDNPRLSPNRPNNNTYNTPQRFGNPIPVHIINNTGNHITTIIAANYYYQQVDLFQYSIDNAPGLNIRNGHNGISVNGSIFIAFPSSGQFELKVYDSSGNYLVYQVNVVSGSKITLGR
jgi:uncharacterized protein YraI